MQEDNLTTTTINDDVENNIEEKNNNNSTSRSNYWPKLFKTIAFCYSFIMLGLSLSALGPSLLKLAGNVHKDIDSMGLVFSLRGVGYVICAMAIGYILDHYSLHATNKNTRAMHPVLKFLLSNMEKIILMLSIFVMGVGMAVTPFLKSFWLLVLTNTCIGIACGAMDCISNIMLLWIWKDEVNPYMQALHFCFGLGAFLSPLILQITEMILVKLNAETKWPSLSTLTPAYLFMALFMFSSILIFFFVKLDTEQDHTDETTKTTDSATLVNNDELASDAPVKTEEQESGEVTPTEVKRGYIQKIKDQMRQPGFLKQIFVCFVSSVALLLYVGCEVGYGGLIASYVQLYHKEHFEHTAALLSSVFWLSFTIGRLIAIPISKYISVRLMLVIDIIVTMVALVTLVISQHHVVIWIATIIAGLGMASQYPATISLPSGHLNMNLSGFLTSLMVTFGAFGEMIIPAIMVVFFNHLMWMLLGLCGVASLLYFVLLFVIPPDNNNKDSKQEFNPVSPSVTGESTETNLELQEQQLQQEDENTL
jgi:FHS family Na+ dependent glucose MFS transporter 1